AVAVARPVGPCLPRCRLAMNLSWLRAGARFHSPDTARAPDVSGVRYEDQFASIGRPRRRKEMIEAAVVVAREIALVVGREAFGVSRAFIVHVDRVDVPAAC